MIKPRLWPRIEFFSSGDQESRHLCVIQQQRFIIICEIDCQSRSCPWDRVLMAGALGWPCGMRWGGMWEGGSEWGTHVHPWPIHVNVWQKPLQYCKVISLQLKQISFLKKLKKKNVDNKACLKGISNLLLIPSTKLGIFIGFKTLVLHHNCWNFLL